MNCYDDLPHSSHEHTLAGLTKQPYSGDVLKEACSNIQDKLVEYFDWPKNVLVHGILHEELWQVYRAGERRGIAREHAPVAALFPVPKKEFEDGAKTIASRYSVVRP